MLLSCSSEPNGCVEEQRRWWLRQILPGGGVERRPGRDAHGVCRPSEWRGMPIPALYSVSERLFECLNGSILLTGKGASFNDALDRLSHVEPRASIRRP